MGQGALTNGWTHTGSISPAGDSDSWTFDANVGDRIIVRVGELTQTGSFAPRIRLMNPSAVQIATASAAVATEVEVTATNTGTFTVIVEDNLGTSATGTYQLTLAKAPGAFAITPGDEGGALSNGMTYEDNYLPPGDLDVWSFTANAGDSFTVKLGQMSDTNSFDPWLRIYGPNGVQLDSDTHPAAAEISMRATNSGTFTVVVANYPYYSDAASGTYRLSLAKTGDSLVTASGDEGGALTNGIAVTGSLPLGDVDAWSFAANAGDSFAIKMGQTSDTNNFDPWIRIYGPDGALLDSDAHPAASESILRATNSGAFLVVVENNPYYSDAAQGTYRLKLAKTADPIVVPLDDEGGSMTNGIAHNGTLPIGDVDIWNFTANAGDSIVIKAGQIVETNAFDPWLRIYGPDGALLDSDTHPSAAEVTLRATNSGTFVVMMENYPYYSDAASGTYLLTLAKTGDPISVSPGDDGGPMTNGAAHVGSLPLGDLDLWNFTANTGDSIVLKAGQITDTNAFDPWIRLYGPDGALLGSQYAASATEVALRATNSGTFLVVIGNNPYYSDAANGTYLLTLAKTGDPYVVSPGDDGGSLTNGVANVANLPIGDLDLWHFNASAGQSIVVRAGQIAETNSFDPWVRVYGPDGALLGSDSAAAVGEVALRATNSGTFLVVIGNYPYYSDAGHGTYLLTLAKTGDEIQVSPGDEGGSMSGNNSYDGNITIGDADLWRFTICAGEFVDIRADEINQTNSFAPWVRLYGPDGALIGSSFGASYGEVINTTTNGGEFLVVIANNDYYNNAGSGSYHLTVNGLSDGLKFCDPIITGTNGTLSAVGGNAASTFVIYTHTNIAAPFATWPSILTNQFDSYGVFLRTNAFDSRDRQRFFRLIPQ